MSDVYMWALIHHMAVNRPLDHNQTLETLLARYCT